MSCSLRSISNALPVNARSLNPTNTPTLPTTSPPPFNNDLTSALPNLSSNTTSNPPLSDTKTTSPSRTLLGSHRNPPAPQPVHCWSQRQIYSIDAPADCRIALANIVKEGHGLTPRQWDAPRSWTYGSCAILLEPESQGLTDVFSPLDVVSVVSQINHVCLTKAFGYRGGYRAIGPLGHFHLSVEALLVH
ncbi:hypothetical protein MMC21_008305 [Puttea exsequens]|nr:hypothetical protein [Puttea exsequens]